MIGDGLTIALDRMAFAGQACRAAPTVLTIRAGRQPQQVARRQQLLAPA